MDDRWKYIAGYVFFLLVIALCVYLAGGWRLHFPFSLILLGVYTVAGVSTSIALLRERR